MNFGKSSSDKQIYLHTMTFIVSTKEFSVSDLVLLKMFSDKNTNSGKGKGKGLTQEGHSKVIYRL